MDDDYIVVEGFGMFPVRRASVSCATVPFFAPRSSHLPCLPGHEDQFWYLMDAEGKLLPASKLNQQSVTDS